MIIKLSLLRTKLSTKYLKALFIFFSTMLYWRVYSFYWWVSLQKEVRKGGEHLRSSLPKNQAKCIQGVTHEGKKRRGFIALYKYLYLISTRNNHRNDQSSKISSVKNISTSQKLQDKLRWHFSCFLNVLNIFEKKKQIEKYEVPPIAWFLHRMVRNSNLNSNNNKNKQKCCLKETRVL